MTKAVDKGMIIGETYESKSGGKSEISNAN